MPAKTMRIDASHSSQPNNRQGSADSVAAKPVALEILRGKARSLVREVHSPVFLIGSASDCDLVLGDKSFPDAYAYLYLNASGISIRYLGEGPQLLVNDQPVEGSPLAVGDRLEMGIFEFRLAEIHTSKPAGDDRPTPAMGRSESRSSSTKASTAGQISAIAQVRELMLDIRREMAAKHATLRLYLGPNIDVTSEQPKLAPRPFTQQLRASA